MVHCCLFLLRSFRLSQFFSLRHRSHKTFENYFYLLDNIKTTWYRACGRGQSAPVAYNQENHMSDTVIISWNFTNWITILLMAVLGWAAYKAIASVVHKRMESQEA